MALRDPGPEELGRRLSKAREVRGLGQKHLADAAGVTQSYVSQVERGEVAEPSAFVIRAFESVLEAYPTYLTEPEAVRLARDMAISKLMAEHGDTLGITPEEIRSLRMVFAVLDPGPNPPLMYMVRLLELVRSRKVQP